MEHVSAEGENPHGINEHSEDARPMKPIMVDTKVEIRQTVPYELRKPLYREGEPGSGTHQMNDPRAPTPRQRVPRR